MKITFAYGKTGLVAEIPDRNLVAVLEPRAVPVIDDPEKEIYRCLADPIGTQPLHALARGKRTACIVISDITRPVPNKTILPPILRTLEDAGLDRDSITLLIATGTHRPNEADELIELVGEEIAGKHRIENHVAADADQHRLLGETKRGMPVSVDTRFLDAELRIVTGMIQPHLCAGFSGGRKSIVPGISGERTVRFWHGPDFIEAPGACSGTLEGNAVHEETLAAAKLTGVDFILNVVGDRNDQIVGVFAGDLEQAHRKGVDFYRSFASVTIDTPVDVVVTSNSGYPLDTTFYQTVKGIEVATHIVKEGGTIILVAGCTEGMGSPEFSQLVRETSNLDDFITKSKTREVYVSGQWSLHQIAMSLRKADIMLVSGGLREMTQKDIFVEPVDSVENALKRCMAKYGSDATIAVIPKGACCLPTVSNSS